MSDDFDDLDDLLATIETDEADDDDEELDEDDEQVPGQETMFGADEDFKRGYQIWQGMPEFLQNDLEPQATVRVHFRSDEDRRAFYEVIGQRFVTGRRAIWYPALTFVNVADKRYRSIEEDRP